ncbi:MAG: LysM domain-containing protein, partial [Tissierellia bacterium]|nr:LysM domain-containing protein [Tissierellia bacterium]
MIIKILLGAVLGAGLLMLFPRKAYAHCDTMDGPAVKD